MAPAGNLADFFAKKKKGKPKAINLNVGAPKPEEEKKEENEEKKEEDPTPTAAPAMVMTLKTEDDEEAKPSRQWNAPPKQQEQKTQGGRGIFQASYMQPGMATNARFPTLESKSNIQVGAAAKDKSRTGNNAFARLQGDMSDDEDEEDQGAVIKVAHVSKVKGVAVSQHQDAAVKATGFFKEETKELTDKEKKALDEEKRKKAEKKAKSEAAKAEIKASLQKKKTEEKVATFDMTKFKYGVFSVAACSEKYMSEGTSFVKRPLQDKYENLSQFMTPPAICAGGDGAEQGA